MLIEPSSTPARRRRTPRSRTGRFGRTRSSRRRPAVALPAPALVHDYLLVMRGAERTFAAMADAWPEAPIYTLLYDRDGIERALRRPRDRDVVAAAPRRPRRAASASCCRSSRSAAERLAGRGPRRSSSRARARSRTGRPAARAACTSATATRRSATPGTSASRARREVPRLWRARCGTRARPHPPTGPRRRRGGSPTTSRTRGSPSSASPSSGAATRSSCTRRSRSTASTPAQPEDWFLTVGELVAHKRTEVALEAARKRRREGQGRRHRPRARAPRGAVRRRRRVPRPRRRRRARGPLRARPRAHHAQRRGVRDRRRRGPGRRPPGRGRSTPAARKETVIDGLTGVLCEDDDGIAEALANVPFERFLSLHAVTQAAKFSTSAFQTALRREVERAWVRSGR